MLCSEGLFKSSLHFVFSNNDSGLSKCLDTLKTSYPLMVVCEFFLEISSLNMNRPISQKNGSPIWNARQIGRLSLHITCVFKRNGINAKLLYLIVIVYKCKFAHRSELSSVLATSIYMLMPEGTWKKCVPLLTLPKTRS